MHWLGLLGGLGGASDIGVAVGPCLVLAFVSVTLLLVSYSLRTEQKATLFAAFDLGTWRAAIGGEPGMVVGYAK